MAGKAGQAARNKVAQIHRQQEAEPDTRRSGHGNVRVKPVRKSIDLPGKDAAALSAWEAETARELGRARVTSAEVVRVLVSRLLTDEQLARQVRQDLTDN